MLRRWRNENLLRCIECRALRTALLICLVLLAACDSRSRLPDRASADYDRFIAAFYGGLAALQVGDDVHADQKLAEATRLAPGEPAAWANWGVLALRQRNFDTAAERLGKARELAPANGHIANLLGALASAQGRSAQAIEFFRKAADADAADLRSRYALAQEIERQGGAGADGQAQEAIEKILAAQPDNVAALLELARIAAKRGDSTTLKRALASIATTASTWPPEAREQLAALEAAASSADVRGAAARTTLLRNVLWRVPEFRQSYAALKAPAGEDAMPFSSFVRLESPTYKTSPPDTALSFERRSIDGFDDARWKWIGALQLASDGAPAISAATGDELHLSTGATLPYPGGVAHAPPTADGVLAIDFDYDFKNDVVLAGEGGVRFFKQHDATRFVDVTAGTMLPEALRDGRYTGAWAADVEADGDLDIVLGSVDRTPVVLRNNGDGTFVAIKPFGGISGIRQFAWADFDGDGNPDAAIIDGQGVLHVFTNRRQGVFAERAIPAQIGNAKAIAVADVDNDGNLDLIVVRAEGTIVRLSDRNEGKEWNIAEIAHVTDPQKNLAGDVRLRVADLDNNGALDLVLTPVGSIWLADGSGKFAQLDRAIGVTHLFAVADVDNDGKLDVIGLGDDGRAERGANRSTKNYHWQIVRPHAAQAFGDQRINPFGVGGEIEIRAGLLVQKQPITGPRVHFGLGEQTRVDVIRVIWPNGAVRAEFDVKADQSIETEQRLKGSCPFLFAYDGTRMAFVKDAVPWGSAIGLRINTLGSASIAATEEWFKIGRDHLVARDGFYDLRMTAELWEVYYYDELALLAVDHPPDTEIFVDERFVIPPAKLAITVVETPRKIATAKDDNGRDVTGLIRDVDGKAVDVGVGQYQGVTRDHYVELDLGSDAPSSGPLYLVAHGSIYPTDSSINVALTQGERWRARGLSVEVPDGFGGWRVANENVGFPAGRKKTMLVDLTNVFVEGTPRRVRLRTNLQIYWDAIEWARGRPDVAIQTTRIDPAIADLHYRGYSHIDRPDAATPELPNYDRIVGTKQRWRDLEGYYTRYGDVRELLARVDDRYVIMNSGDEMTVKFAEPAPAPQRWLRDFVIVGDGWIKDGDYNSTFSRTVQPLPFHAERDYTTMASRLEDESAYRLHPDDWQTYHTRYVAPDVFKRALRDEAQR